MAKKILYVEDQARLRNVLSDLLQKSGFEVFTASDGELGLKIIEEKKPDLVLLDLILPKKDGFEVLEILRSKKETEHLPVVILTNLEEKYDIERAMAYGVRAYLVKTNYGIDELVEKIKEILK
jgi:two-component system alkaline phosphatase synthesis response regulator PhoP